MIRARFHPHLLIVALTLGVILSISACDGTDAQREFEAQAQLPPSGITPMDADGNPTGDPDPDDWRTGPAFPGVVVEPAYPNPVPVGFSPPVQIHVNVPFPANIVGGMQLVIWDPRPPPRHPVLIDAIQPGSVFHFNTLGFTRSDVQARLHLADARGLYRVYIQDGSGRLISYGDIQID